MTDDRGAGPTTEAAAARPHTARGEERREALVACATRLFAEHGVDATPVARIVDELGCGKGVFYWYFPSKEALVTDIVASAMSDLRRAQQRGLADAPDPLARIAAGLRASMRWYADHPELVRLMAWARTQQGYAELMNSGQERALADVERHVRAAVSAGQIPPGHPTVRSEAVVGAALQLAYGTISRRGLDPDTVAEAAVGFCLAGLRAPS